MIAYQTDAEGIYVGEVECVLSPLDDDGTYLIPWGAVTKAPPAIPAGSQARWNGKKWIIEPIPVPIELVEEMPPLEPLESLPEPPLPSEVTA